jgi:uncharacterized protein
VANALARESSPYLRQHARNPVDWLPWGSEAFERASRSDRPLLVSIGYSSCHWCHVMERESFEDERTAQLMNESFVCVKVDREERPDIDAIYMEAVQAMTGHGGWPLNVFLTPDQIPFYGGTYFPPEPRHGMPAFVQVLQAVAEAWSERREEIVKDSVGVSERLAGGATLRSSSAALDPHALEQAVARLEELFDDQRGGFGGAPKFPQASVIELLLAHEAAPQAPGSATGGSPAREMALTTLRAMASGGIHDVLGGGFHRYSVDASWTVPHFEKMLYDNALLAKAYLHGYQLSGEHRMLEVCLGTLEWALREMRGPEGGFYSALDADSEGVEGSFYVWTMRELRELLGEDAKSAIEWLGVTEQGNFNDPHHPQPGLNVLADRGARPDAPSAKRIASTLLRARERRASPALDDKRLCAWNALMVSALAQAGAHLLRSPTRELERDLPAADIGSGLLDAAGACADFIMREMRDDRGRLLRTYSEGEAKLDAYLEDHAFLLEALLDLYEASFDERWFVAARTLAREMIARFGDPEHGGFFSTASDHEALIARRKDLEDSPIPAGGSSAALGLLRLAALTGDHSYERQAVSVLRLVHEIAIRFPSSFGHLLQALQFYLLPVREIALVGPPGPELDRLLGVVHDRLRPQVVLASGPGDCGDSVVPLLLGRLQVNGHAAAYVCEHFTCQGPVTAPEELSRLLYTARAPVTGSPGTGPAPIG